MQVNNTSNGNVTLHVGATTTTVEVQASGVQVNTEQATVQGVITTAADRKFAHEWPQLPGIGAA